MNERGRIAVLMYDGSHDRHEGADVYMPNADMDCVPIAPLTGPLALVFYLRLHKVKESF